MAILPRSADGDYHFHTYDFARSEPFKLSPRQPRRGLMQFYSLFKDLNALLLEGRSRGVPKIALTGVGGPITNNPVVHMLALSFGKTTPGTPSVVFTGGIHGCEWIAPEMAYLLAEYLIKNYTAVSKNPYQDMIRELVNTRWIHIIPMLNPVGNGYTVFSDKQGARLWRKSRRPLPTTADGWEALLTTDGKPNWPFRNVKRMQGTAKMQYDVPQYASAPNDDLTYGSYELELNQVGVDLNRSYATPAWGFNTAPDDQFIPQAIPSSNSYFGPRASAEPETARIVQLLADVAPVGAAIDYHSYGQLILYPTETWDAGKVDPGYELFGRMLRQLAGPQADPRYRLGTPAKLLGYNATGTVADYVALQHQGRAFSIELDPTDQPDPGTGGFQLPENQIRRVFEENIRGALAAIAAVNYGPAMINAAWSEFRDWDVYNRGNALPL